MALRPRWGAGVRLFSPVAGLALAAAIWAGGAGATLVAASSTPASSPSSRAAADVPGQPDLQLSLTTDPDPARLGATILVTATVVNAGAADATGVVLSNPLPLEATFVGADASRGGCSFDGDGVTCRLGTIRQGAAASVTLTLRPTGAGAVSDAASVTAAETDANPADNGGVLTTHVGAPDLAVTVRPERDQVPVGTEVTFRIIVANNGDLSATGTTVTISIPAATTLVAATPSQGTGCTVTSRAVVCRFGVLAAGASGTVDLVVRPSGEGIATATASATATEMDASMANNSGSDTTVVTAALPDLVVNVTDAKDPVTSPGPVRDAVRVRNAGSGIATSVVVKNPLPAGTTFASASSTQGSCSFDGTRVTCALGSLAPASSATVTLSFNAPGEKLVTDTATATSAQADADPSNNSASQTTTVTLLSVYPDPTYGADGRVRTIAYSGNRVYLAGDFTHVLAPGTGTPVARNHAAALNATTGQLLAWNPSTNAAVTSLSVSPDGQTVYLGGYFTSVHSQFRNHLAAVDAVYGDPRSWAPSANAPIHAVRVSGDGSRLYVGGAFTTVNGNPRLHLAAFNTATGGLLAWSPRVEYPGTPQAANIRSLALSPDGLSLYIGGVFETVNGQAHRSVAKIDIASASPIASWDAGLEKKVNKTQAAVYAIATSSRYVFICGDFWIVDGLPSPNIAELFADTGARRFFWHVMTDGAVNTCTTSDTHVYFGGHFDRVMQKFYETGVVRHHVASVAIQNATLSLWNPGANSTQGLYASAVSPGRLAVGGEFTQIGMGADQPHFAQFSGTP
jgi:uncharacterized repeat protein (TIGR01451 family)